MDKHTYICKTTETVALKSTCDRAHIGAVFINEDYEILVTGYNGAPRKHPHCDDVGHLMENNHCVRTTHAEQNAIVQAAKRGVSLKGSILYVTHSPCFICCKLLINLQVKKIFVKSFYRDRRSYEWFVQSNIPIQQWIKMPSKL